MTANVTFVYAERKDVLRIPNAALRFRPPDELLAARGRAGGGGGKSETKKQGRVQRPTADGGARASAGDEERLGADGEKLREVPVELGVSDGNKVEVERRRAGRG